MGHVCRLSRQPERCRRAASRHPRRARQPRHLQRRAEGRPRRLLLSLRRPAAAPRVAGAARARAAPAGGGGGGGQQQRRRRLPRGLAAGPGSHPRARPAQPRQFRGPGAARLPSRDGGRAGRHRGAAAGGVRPAAGRRVRPLPSLHHRLCASPRLWRRRRPGARRLPAAAHAQRPDPPAGGARRRGRAVGPPARRAGAAPAPRAPHPRRRPHGGAGGGGLEGRPALQAGLPFAVCPTLLRSDAVAAGLAASLGCHAKPAARPALLSPALPSPRPAGSWPWMAATCRSPTSFSTRDTPR